MSEKLSPLPHFAVQAAVFEASLAGMALALGWAIDQSPSATIRLTVPAFATGVLAVLPLLGMMLACRRSSWGPVQALSRVLDEIVVPLFRNCNWIELAAISFLAGMGEELLFRGLLQTTMAEWTDEFLPHSPDWAAVGDWIALITVGVAFGALHALNAAYAVLAALMGIYLGWLFFATGNLAVPILAHGLYDFLALTYFAGQGARSEAMMDGALRTWRRDLSLLAFWKGGQG
jgi:membrane protease YdiL (CAAX protease family)